MKQAEIIKTMTDKEILLNLYITQIIMIIASIVLSWFLFDSWKDLLSLFKWDPYQIIVIGGGVGLLVVILQLFLEKIIPKERLDDGGINERVFKNRGIRHLFILAFFIAFAEELLFRGVLQTNFGIIPASLLFAVIHFRYLHKFILFTITVALSFLLGWLYVSTANLFVPIFSHFIIDFVLGCILRFRKTENQV